VDPFTHAISGMALARAIPGRPLPGKQVALLALLAMAPDADYILIFFSDVVYLQYHRGITHSLLMLPLWTWLCYSLLPDRRTQQPAMPWLVGGALLTHIFLDLITAYGTMILAPFSDWRASLDLIFIIDPLFTLCLLLPLLPAAVWKHHSRKLGLLSLTLAAAYIALAAFNHAQAVATARKEIPHATQVDALPMPFSPFHWQVIADASDTSYARAMIDLAPALPDIAGFLPAAFTHRIIAPLPAGALQWQSFVKMEGHMSWGEKVDGVDFYRWFARYPVLLRPARRNRLDFGDLQFGIYRHEADWPFRLQVDSGKTAQAWLVWHNDRKTGLSGG